MSEHSPRMTTRQPAAERPPLAGAARTWLTLFPFAVAMHNTEELPNMQRWVQNAVDNGYPRAFDPAFYQPTRLWVPMILMDLLAAAAFAVAFGPLVAALLRLGRLIPEVIA